MHGEIGVGGIIMNFIWDIALQAERDGLSLDKLFFQPSEDPSPCYEQSFSCLNQSHVDEARVEINPLMRFAEIFQYLLHPDVFFFLEAENQQCILYVFDAFVHVLTEIDLCHGMTKREFYVRQVRRELLWGVYGREAREACLTLSKEQQLAVAEELLNVMQMGSCLDSFCRIMRQLFPGCFIYQVKKHPQILYVYLDRVRDVALEKRWNLLRDTFLPMDMEVRVFWEMHFGILGVDVTMQSDAIAIF